MDPRAKHPVATEAIREFLTLTEAEDMVEWNRRHTPWIFTLGDDIEKVLLQQYRDQLEGEIEIKELEEEENDEEKKE